MTPDYSLMATLVALIVAGWWLSEKIQQLREDRIERETVAEMRKRNFKLVRPGE